MALAPALLRQDPWPECLEHGSLVERAGRSRVAADAWVVTFDFIGCSYLEEGGRKGGGDTLWVEGKAVEGKAQRMPTSPRLSATSKLPRC